MCLTLKKHENNISLSMFLACYNKIMSFSKVSQVGTWVSNMNHFLMVFNLDFGGCNILLCSSEIYCMFLFVYVIYLFLNFKFFLRRRLRSSFTKPYIIINHLLLLVYYKQSTIISLALLIVYY